MKTFKREEIYANQYADLDHLRANIQEFVEQYYNRQRLHSALGYLPPEEFEQVAHPEATSTGARMSFSGIRRSIDPIGKRSRPKPAPRTIVSMSLRLVIPRRVALQQSPLPLRQPILSLRKDSRFEKYNPFNGKCSYRKLSHGRVPHPSPV
jgi:hypothetical protein